jgi:amino acid permease
MESEDTSAVIAEFQALRDEILKRAEFQYQVINLTLIVASAFLSIGAQTNVAASVLLVYPLIALFLSSAWANNGNHIKRIGRYILRCLEAKAIGLGWESYIKQQTGVQRPEFLETISTSGLFLVTEFLSVGLALTKLSYTTIEVVLLIGSICAIMLTLLVFWRASRGWRAFPRTEG